MALFFWRYWWFRIFSQCASNWSSSHHSFGKWLGVYTECVGEYSMCKHGPRLVIQWEKRHLSRRLLGSRCSKHEGVNSLKAQWTWIYEWPHVNPLQNSSIKQWISADQGAGSFKKQYNDISHQANKFPTKPAPCSHGGAERAAMEAGGACPGVLGIVCCQCVLLLVLSWLKPVGFGGLSPARPSRLT